MGPGNASLYGGIAAVSRQHVEITLTQLIRTGNTMELWYVAAADATIMDAYFYA